MTEPETVKTRFRLTRKQRLGLDADFRRVFARRCAASDDKLVVYVDGNDLAFCRLGMRVGKRLGGAVVRARVRRLIREAFRLEQHGLAGGLDVVCIPKPPPRDAADYCAALPKLIERAAQKLRDRSDNKTDEGRP